MKKIMILAAGLAAFALPASAQISIAPEVGLNLANMHWQLNDNDSSKLDNGIKLGVRAGVNFNIPITPDRLVLQPGIFYSIQGMKSEEDGFAQNITLHYAQIPVNLIYMFNDPSEGRFFVGVGPYVGIAFSGKNKTHGGGGPDKTTDLTFGSGADQSLGRIDYGAQASLGYLLRSGIFFRGMYQHGIGDLVPSESPLQTEAYVHNTCITISVGYQLGHKPKDRGPRMSGSKPTSN
jgi:hypothetical protein